MQRHANRGDHSLIARAAERTARVLQRGDHVNRVDCTPNRDRGAKDTCGAGQYGQTALALRRRRSSVIEQHNEPTLSGRAGDHQSPNHEERNARPVRSSRRTGLSRRDPSADHTRSGPPPPRRRAL